jgi:hypothetical protein
MAGQRFPINGRLASRKTQQDTGSASVQRMGQRNGDPDKQKRSVRIARTPQRVRADEGFASLQRSAAERRANA